MTFSSAGKYVLSVTESDQAGDTVTEQVSFTVAQTLTSITVSPGTASVKGGGTQQFQAAAYDQFQHAISPSTYTWTASSGSITSGGLFTAQNSSATDTITASSGGVSGKATVTVTATAALTSIAVYPQGGKVAVGSSTLSVTGTSEALSAVALDQNGNPLATQPSLSWSTTAEPSGATATLVGSGGSVTLDFNRAGQYTETVTTTVNGVKVTTTVSIDVVAEPTSLVVTGPTGTVTGTTAQFTCQLYDQFHNLISSGTTLAWSALTVPSGAAAPTFSSSGSTTTVTFSSAGQYSLSVTDTDQSVGSVSNTISVPVAQTLTSLKVTPGTASLSTGGTQQFQATAYDQFQHTMSAPSAYTWTASGGSITTSGLFTAPSGAATDTVTAKLGAVSGSATVTRDGARAAPATVGPNIPRRDAGLR